jgi:hypothetical protein
MTVFVLRIECDNSAFQSTCGDDKNFRRDAEVAGILRIITKTVEAGSYTKSPNAIKDSNGNQVGTFAFSK